MKFKKWLLFSENIIIKDMNYESVLSLIPGKLIEFDYQWDNGYSTYTIGVYQAQRIGHLHIGTQGTHIGIIKHSPIESSTGVDISFIKSLSSVLQSAGFKAIEYKESSDSEWLGAINKEVGDQFKAQGDKDFNKSATPAFGTGAGNSKKVASGIQMSRASGSWAYFFRSSSPEFILPKSPAYLKKAAQPLIDHDLIDYYKIVDRKTQKTLEVVYSNKGQQDHDSHVSKFESNVAYMKYLVETTLKNYPNAKSFVLKNINTLGKDIQPSNQFKINFDELININKNNYADNGAIKYFLQAVKDNNKVLFDALEVAEKAIESLDQNINPAYFVHIVYQIIEDELIDVLIPDEKFDDIRYYDALRVFKLDRYLENITSSFNKFKSEFKEKFTERLSSKEPLRPNNVRYVKELAEYFDLPKEIIDHLTKLDSEESERTRTREEQIKANREKSKHLIYDDSVKYIVMKDDTIWDKIPDQYVNFNGFGSDHHDIDVGEFVTGEGIVTSDDVMEDAYEKAMEDAYDHVEARPSESYGEDEDEIMSDIEDDWDDFAQDTDLYEKEDIKEDATNDEVISLIQNNHLEEFKKWKIEKLKEEEEEESWKYEPEPDQSDVSKYVEELAGEFAYDQLGLVTMSKEPASIVITLNSKFYKQFKPILQKTLDINIKEKTGEYGEPNLRLINKIEIEFTDKVGFKTTVGKILKEHGF